MYITIPTMTRVVAPRGHLLHGAGLEALVEYAGRLCYHSLDKMGKAANFVAQRVKEGHDDILEHVRYVVEIGGVKVERLLPLLTMPSVFYVQTRYSLFVSLNLRHIIDFYRKVLEMPASQVERELYPIAHHLMVWVLTGVPSLKELFPNLALFPIRHEIPDENWKQGKANDDVLLLAFTPLRDDMPWELGAATFYIGGISRACSHQLVRHRLCSFSQQSQRYVHLDKGGWEPVIPPSIVANPEAKAVMEEAWKGLGDAYRRLTAMGIPKEDARFLLPNAAETRLVMTIPYGTLRHFLNLRLHKSAQWEIRRVAERIRDILMEVHQTSF